MDAIGRKSPEICFSDGLKVKISEASLRLPKHFELRGV